MKIPGFGHRVYKVVDPRAMHLRKLSQELGKRTGHEDLYQKSAEVERIIKEQKDLNANVDFYSASTYYSLGIPVDLFTPIFAVSRISGWTAHILEQYRNNRLDSSACRLHRLRGRTRVGASRSALVMHDLNFFRNNLESIRERLGKRGFELDITAFQELDRKRRQAVTESEQLKAERNAASVEISKLRKSGVDTSERQQQVRAMGEKIS